MGRQISNLTFGPAGVCDACGRYSWCMIGVCIPCYFCNAGVFLPRWCYNFTECPFCAGRDLDCPVCFGKNVMATPKQELTMDDVRRAWRQGVERYKPYPAPPLVVALAALADSTELAPPAVAR